MKQKIIKVSAPATVSNVGPGFDIMGFAINTSVEEMILRLTDNPVLKSKKLQVIKTSCPLT